LTIENALIKTMDDSAGHRHDIHIPFPGSARSNNTASETNTILYLANIILIGQAMSIVTAFESG
jgi:hypothetical protein